MKGKKALFISFLTIFMLLFSASMASAKVMWGKTELKKGQIGKITVTQPINLWERDANNKLKLSRVLNPGEEYRVYRYDNLYGGQYGLGGGMYITKMPNHIKYETPSKAKLALLEKETTKGTVKNSDLENALKELAKQEPGFVLFDGSFELGIMDENHLTPWLGYQDAGWGDDLWGAKVTIISNDSATFTYEHFYDDPTIYNDGVIKLVENKLLVTYTNNYDGTKRTLTFSLNDMY